MSVLAGLEEYNLAECAPTCEICMPDVNDIQSDELHKLVKAAQNGDKDAFGVIYDYFVDSLYRYIFFRVPQDEVEDLLETLFLKVWENLYQYKAEKASFKSWIFRIAHNLVVDFYRLNKSVEELTDQYKDDRTERQPLHTTENVLNSMILNKALKKIKKTYAQFITLKFVNDLSNKEIALILNKSEGSLRIIQYRALKHLKKVLEEMGVSSL